MDSCALLFVSGVVAKQCKRPAPAPVLYHYDMQVSRETNITKTKKEVRHAYPYHISPASPPAPIAGGKTARRPGCYFFNYISFPARPSVPSRRSHHFSTKVPQHRLTAYCGCVIYTLSWDAGDISWRDQRWGLHRSLQFILYIMRSILWFTFTYPPHPVGWQINAVLYCTSGVQIACVLLPTSSPNAIEYNIGRLVHPPNLVLPAD
jgi:hypothetical protein